jgi:hypothetical protein
MMAPTYFPIRGLVPGSGDSFCALDAREIGDES